jgi:hypothetical protein
LANNFGTGAEVVTNCNGELIPCREQYYVKHSVKSKSYAEDIEFAVNEALSRVSDEESDKCIANSYEKYSREKNLKKIEDILGRVENHITELKNSNQ